MKPITQVIEESTALGKRLLAENPGMWSVDFKFKGYSPDEVRQAAAELTSYVELGRYSETVHFCHCPTPHITIFIHSVKVKMVEMVVEETDNA